MASSMSYVQGGQRSSATQGGGTFVHAGTSVDSTQGAGTFLFSTQGAGTFAPAARPAAVRVA